jgi:hypothetical protein
LFDRDVAARVAAIEKVLRAQLLAGPISHEDVVLRNVAVHCHCEGKPFGDLSMVEARRYQRGARRVRGLAVPSASSSTASSSCGGLSGHGEIGGDEVARLQLCVSSGKAHGFDDLVFARSEVRHVEGMPSQKNEKQEKAKLPRQGGPIPERDSEKQDIAKLPRQGGEGGDVEVEVPGHKQVKVPMIMKQQKFVAVPQVEFVERIAHDPVQKQIQVPMTQVPVHEQMHEPMIMKKQKCVDEPQVEFVDKVVKVPVKELVIGGMKEIFIGGMPVTSTKEFVVGIIGQFCIVESCELLPCAWGLTVKLKMATAEKAQWIVWNLNRNIAVGLELPIYVGFTMDCGFNEAS